jgi:hypothetical protein
MALFIFRSRAASQILMQSATAQQLLDIIGKPLAERGVITAAQVDGALDALLRAVERSPRDIPVDEGPEPPPVGLRQRAYPLIEMLRAARQRQVDVTWGV